MAERLLQHSANSTSGTNDLNRAVTPPADDLAAAIFAGPGAMRALCRDHDWAATPLGAVVHWPPALRIAASIALGSAFPTIVLWGPELIQLYNDGYREVMGGKHPAGLGQPTYECWPEVRHINEPIYERVRAGETVILEDALYPLARSGTVEDAWFTLSYSPVRDDAGAIGGVLITIFETTTQVRARDARELERESLLASAEAAHAQVTTVLESISDAFYAVDADFRFTYVSGKAEELWGRRRETLIGRHYVSEFPHVVGSESHGMQLRVMAERAPVRFDTISAILGTWIEASIYPSADGGLSCYFRDITDRKEAEAALRASEARYRTLFESIDEGFCVIEVLFDEMGRANDYRFLEANPAFVKQTGLVDVVGRRMRELAPGHEGHWFEVYGDVARTGEPVRFDARADALNRWYDVYAFRIGRPDEHRVAVLFDDVSTARAAALERERLLAESERMRAEAEAARADAEAANRAKSEFLAVMSHELRTPLNAIDGYAELMELGIRGPLTPEQRKDLGRIRHSQRHLLGLINGVLNYSRVEAGAVRYDIEDVPLDEVLATCEALTAPQRRAKKLDFRYDGCDTALRARADGEKLQQIVLNLLTNAMKFTEPGGRVELDCTVNGDTVGITVTDTGRGIAAEHLERVFEPFVQVDTSRTRTQEGVGLGLAISRDLARGMGGDIVAASTKDVGSTFTLTLPACV